MIVEDEPDLLATTRMMLEKESYKVHGFSNPIAALSHVEDGCKDCKLVLSDIRMSGMSGFELVRRVKELCPDSMKKRQGYRTSSPGFASRQDGNFIYCIGKGQRNGGNGHGNICFLD